MLQGELNTSNRLGKFLFNRDKYEIRQLIYKMHKIFYAIDKEKLYILTVTHTKRNPTEIIKIIKNNFSI